MAVSEEFLPSLDPVTGAPVPVGDDEAVESPRIDEHHEIELDPVFHDELALTEPMHPLCRPDCPGLCSCAARSSARATTLTAVDEIDPRLAGLAALLRNGDGDEGS